MPPDLGSLKGTAWEHLSGYYGMVKRLDEALGRIRDALKSLGMEENTILVFSTDHGCHFKTRNKEYKRSCHESSIRIPLAFYGGPFTGAGKLREKVSLVDLAPTLLDACGIPVPADMQGRSIMPWVRRETTTPSGKDIFVQISESQVGRAIGQTAGNIPWKRWIKTRFRMPEARNIPKPSFTIWSMTPTNYIT